MTAGAGSGWLIFGKPCGRPDDVVEVLGAAAGGSGEAEVVAFGEGEGADAGDEVGAGESFGSGEGLAAGDDSGGVEVDSAAIAPTS